jgi:hypothetical protein
MFVGANVNIGFGNDLRTASGEVDLEDDGDDEEDEVTCVPLDTDCVVVLAALLVKIGRSVDKLGDVCVATFHVTAVWVDCVTGTAVTLHDSPLSMSLSSLLPSPGRLSEKRSIRSKSTCDDCLLSLG